LDKNVCSCYIPQYQRNIPFQKGEISPWPEIFYLKKDAYFVLINNFKYLLLKTYHQAIYFLDPREKLNQSNKQFSKQ